MEGPRRPGGRSPPGCGPGTRRRTPHGRECALGAGVGSAPGRRSTAPAGLPVRRPAAGM